MSIEDEIQVYADVKVSKLTGETESFDMKFFSKVIRKRELELIKQRLQAKMPKLILDYGCGGGWLSLLLRKWGFDTVSMDVSKHMVKSSKLVCPEGDFVVCDAMRLPFRAGVFDFILGISILHHLNLNDALNELKRISLSKSVFLFMEPNLLNPLSAFGRRFFPMEAHTKGEMQFTTRYLERALNLANFNVERCFALFFMAFPVARFSKIAKITLPSLLTSMISLFENTMEKLPIIQNLNANIVVIGTILIDFNGGKKVTH